MTAFNGFLLTLFEKYAALLKKRFSDDFLEVGFDNVMSRCPTDLCYLGCFD